MTNLIVCVAMFYVLHLFLVMSFSLHKVPFIQWTYTGGDISAKTALSERFACARDNLQQSLPIFLVLAILVLEFYIYLAQQQIYIGLKWLDLLYGFHL